MKKILFLMFIMGFFSPLINAYEYTVYTYSPYNRIRVLTDSQGHLYYQQIDNGVGGAFYAPNSTVFWSTLNSVSKNQSNFISKIKFIEYYRNDLLFLNDLYTQSLQQFLNFIYNSNVFSSTNYINYDNYELLYNDEGFAVESIVEGVWAGLYSDSQKSKSGALYNKNGSLVYYNGKEVTPAVSFFVWLQKFTNKVVIETFQEIQRSFISGIIAAVVLVLAIVRLVLELLPSSITPRRRRYYGGGRGTLPDYGDGLQVAASVRARLAAKNRALKARAYDRSGVEESTVNGILFDLENDR